MMATALPVRPLSTHTSALTFTVYTRDRCCCCHNALEILRRYQRTHGFHIQERDVDADPSHAERYGDSVPVVEVNGKVRFRGVVNEVLLERLLESEASAH